MEELLRRPRVRARQSSPESGAPRTLLSVVVPCANEREVLPETNRRLLAVLESMALDFEIVYVDDGSTDSTPDLPVRASPRRIRARRAGDS